MGGSYSLPVNFTSFSGVVVSVKYDFEFNINLIA